MATLTIVADIIAQKDKINLVKSELEKLIPITLKEKGCLQYDLHQDNQNPAHFVFYENWESRELWQSHMATPHFADFEAATEGAIADVQIYEMTKIS